MSCKRKLAAWAMFLHSEHKSYKGTLETLELTPIGSRTCHVPSMDPTVACHEFHGRFVILLRCF